MAGVERDSKIQKNSKIEKRIELKLKKSLLGLIVFLSLLTLT
ncbi:peptidoglycan-binding protein LysM, partial [Enterococcus faecalis]